MYFRVVHTIVGCLLLILTVWIGSWNTAHSFEQVLMVKHHHNGVVCKTPATHLSADAGHHNFPVKGKLPHKARVHFHITKLVVAQGPITFSHPAGTSARPMPGFAQAYPYLFFCEITPPPPKAS